MSGTDWNELERAWQSLPAGAAPVAKELKRMRRWRFVARAAVVGDIVMTIVGVAIGIYLISRSDLFSVICGVAAILFTLGAAATAYWARAVSHKVSDASVDEALNLAVRNARIGVRLSIAYFWSVCFALLFTAVVALATAWTGPYDGARMQGVFVSLGLAELWLAVVVGATIVYHGRRRADLDRLEKLRDSFRV